MNIIFKSHTLYFLEKVPILTTNLKINHFSRLGSFWIFSCVRNLDISFLNFLLQKSCRNKARLFICTPKKYCGRLVSVAKSQAFHSLERLKQNSFLQPILIQYQTDKWWELRKVSTKGLLVDPKPNSLN